MFVKKSLNSCNLSFHKTVQQFARERKKSRFCMSVTVIYGVQRTECSSACYTQGIIYGASSGKCFSLSLEMLETQAKNCFNCCEKLLQKKIPKEKINQFICCKKKTVFAMRKDENCVWVKQNGNEMWQAT